MYSLKQKVFRAFNKGEEEVVLTLEEANAILAEFKQLDNKLTEYSEYLPVEVIRKECEGMFGPRPDDSRKRCVHCNQLPADNAGIECCDAYDGSFYWMDE